MKKILLITALLLTYKIGCTQPPPDPITGCWPPPCIPIDGGISFLLIAGAAYGGKKLNDTRKRNFTKSENKV
jgi:hypothetical protein